MKIEYLAFYKPGVHLLLCGGDDGCGSLIGDAEAHTKWHEKIDRMTHSWKWRDPSTELTGEVCTDPDCMIPRKPGRPMHGPHTIRAGGE